MVKIPKPKYKIGDVVVYTTKDGTDQYEVSGAFLGRNTKMWFYNLGRYITIKEKDILYKL